ncbi:hypothetical protein Patl1_28403 [Pistacia atlantica]|uniref:Uncharacterized protein n=1 Tax=Pistacia atlantica TaxID=434234 RepID=A0ACC1BCZ5_9ROSI|nr:hypothetical protein Patl1_28403 [Pistacia atlantica]
MTKSTSIVNTPLRRSARFLHLHKTPPPQPQDPNTQNPKFTNNRRRSARLDSTPKTQTRKMKASKEPCRPSCGSREPPRLNDGVVSSQSLRRSPRFCSNPIAEQVVKKSGNEKSKKRISIVMGLKAFRAEGMKMKDREIGEENEEINVKRERKCGEEGKKSGKIRIEEGGQKNKRWHCREHISLRSPLLISGRRLPGKSSQECFDKVHSEHLTPTQPRPQSRANKINSSPIEQFSLSAKKPGISSEIPREIFWKQKKPLSRFSSSCGTALVSPPVLKQVKNIALHEKYIDQLHNREAKRKAASARADRIVTGKENKRGIPGLEFDVVRAAKIAMVTDAQNAINQLQHLQANTMRESFDFDCDGVSCDDDEGESEL